jgi:hypothetical protein
MLQHEQRYAPLLAFVLTFAIFLPFSSMGIDVLHDGLMLKAGLDVLHGKVLFRESFTQYGALTTYIHALALWLFDEKLIALRWVTVLFYAGASSALVLVWQRFLPWPLVRWVFVAWLAMAPFYSRQWGMVPWSSVPALFFQAVALLFLIRALELKKYRAALFCGISAAAVVWCRMPVGVLLEVSGVLAFAIAAIHRKSTQDLKLLAVFLAGSLVVHGGFFGQLAATSSLSDWYYQNIAWPAAWATESPVTEALLQSLLVLRSPFFQSNQGAFRLVSLAFFSAAVLYPFASRQTGRRFYLTELAFVLAAAALEWEFFRSDEAWGFLVPLVILAAVLPMIAKALLGREPAGDALFLPAIGAGIAATASWAQYYPVTCPRHIYWALSPGLGICVYFLMKSFPRARIKQVATGLCLVLAPLLISKMWQARLHALESRYPFAAPNLAGLRGTQAEAEHFDYVYGILGPALDRSPAPPLLIDGYDAFWASWSKNSRGFTPFYIQLKAMELGPGFEEKKARFIREMRPVILVSGTSGARVKEYTRKFGYHSRSIDPGVGWLLEPN